MIANNHHGTCVCVGPLFMSKVKQESLERLINTYEQAKLDGNTTLMRLIKAVIDRVKSDNKK